MVGLILPSLGKDWMISAAFLNWASDMVVVVEVVEVNEQPA